jgi:protein-S-isoprenylcysteine O-methyltransferase Ste14
VQPGDALVLLAWAVFGVVWIVGAFRTARTVKRSVGWDRLLIALAVVLGILALRGGATGGGALVVLSRSAAGGLELAIGAVVLYAGLAFAVWARVHLGRYWSGMVTLKEGHELIRTGPYAIVRHPIYTGILAMALGTALATGSWPLLLILVALLASFLLKIRAEEKLMIEQFGDAYRSYMREVPRLVPGVW